MSLYYRSDSVMLERMLPDGAYHAGVYAQGFRFFEASNMIAYLFAVLLLPIFSKMIKDKQAIDDMLRLSFKTLMSGALILGVSCMFYAQQLLELRYETVSDQAAQSFAVLMLCFISICATYIFGTLLTANGSLRQLNYLAAGGMVLNIVLNFWLIPEYFALGSAVASLVTQFLTAAAQVVLALQVFKLKPDLKLAGSFFLFAAGVVFIGWLSLGFTENVLGNLSMMWALSLLWALLTRMFSVRHIYSIVRYGR
jgi:O-antigen/teichoic acid export membrane protein